MQQFDAALDVHAPHTVRAYCCVGARLMGALAADGTDLRRATVEDVQEGRDPSIDPMTRHLRRNVAERRFLCHLEHHRRTLLADHD